jgi:hypothetical protein
MFNFLDGCHLRDICGDFFWVFDFREGWEPHFLIKGVWYPFKLRWQTLSMRSLALVVFSWQALYVSALTQDIMLSRKTLDLSLLTHEITLSWQTNYSCILALHRVHKCIWLSFASFISDDYSWQIFVLNRNRFLGIAVKLLSLKTFHLCIDLNLHAGIQALALHEKRRLNDRSGLERELDNDHDLWVCAVFDDVIERCFIFDVDCFVHHLVLSFKHRRALV